MAMLIRVFRAITLVETHTPPDRQNSDEWHMFLGGSFSFFTGSHPWLFPYSTFSLSISLASAPIISAPRLWGA